MQDVLFPLIPQLGPFLGVLCCVFQLASFENSLGVVPGLTLSCVCFSAQCMTWTITWSSMEFISL